MDYYIKKTRNKLDKMISIWVELNNSYHGYMQ